MKTKTYKRIRVGEYVFSKIDTAAFFQVLKVINGIATIKQIDNLAVASLRETIIYNVPVNELYNNYM